VADTVCCFAMGNPCSKKGSEDDKSNGHNDCERCKNESKTPLVPFLLPHFCPRVGMSADVLEKSDDGSD